MKASQDIQDSTFKHTHEVVLYRGKKKDSAIHYM